MTIHVGLHNIDFDKTEITSFADPGGFMTIKIYSENGGHVNLFIHKPEEIQRLLSDIESGFKECVNDEITHTWKESRVEKKEEEGEGE